MESKVLCPICGTYWDHSVIESHAWNCTGQVELIPELENEDFSPSHNTDPMDCELRCFICQKADASLLHFLADCAHCACKSCLRDFIMNKVSCNEPSKICCTFEGCSRPFTDIDYKELLSREEYELYQASTLAELVTTMPGNFTKCPKCSEILEILESTNNKPSSNGNHLGQGNSMSKEALDHHDTYRFRCRSCETEFCSKCAAVPYHLGFTCESFKTYQTSAHCRFCSVQLKKDNQAPPLHFPATLRDVCNQPDCISRRDQSCAAQLSCGHACGGIVSDSLYDHLPCLQCPPQPGTQAQVADDYCNICWSESLSASPCIKLACSHVFHHHCILKQISGKWAGVVITFGFLECPLCKTQMSHPALAPILKPHLDLLEDIKTKAKARFEHMKLGDAKELADVNGPYYKNPEKYAMARFCYYPCFKCKKPYFGGLKECNAEQRVAGADDKLEDLICGSCAAVGTGANSSCSKHGTDYIEYKCKFCCNVAAWYCWGSTHFCEDCHKKAAEVAKIPKNKLPPCTCKGNHPPNGEEHCLGCSVCRFEDF